ncbi:MAG: ATP-dependent DNA ligase [Candidatus Aenigmarchaeota archaeon]|nr:ATP-dependent DNA ligase [Candidatus Aenigmarchaeota archaeon]
MQYIKLARLYEELEATAKKLEKRDILAVFYKQAPENDLAIVTMMSMGIVAADIDLGIASQMMIRVAAKTYGIPEKEIVQKLKETGDLGLAAEYFAKNRKQQAFFKKELSIDNVFENIRKLPELSGSGSQDKKISLIAELLSHAQPLEARYIVRTTLGDMRIGVAHGIVRDAIALAFNKEPKEVENSWNVTGDFGKVAEMAKNGKLKADIILGNPVRVMLADRSPDLKEALEEFEHAAIEFKLDGLRMQIHKDCEKIRLFSRRLDELTSQFPEIVKWCRECIKAKQCIVEGEVIAVDSKGNPLPFQHLSRRIQRKYDIERMTKEIPIQINLFDLIYLDGKSWMQKPLKERWQRLNEIIKQSKTFMFVNHIETKDCSKAEKFYTQALAAGEEGVIVKNLDAQYQPGKRVGYWLKVKPIMEPLDLVIIGGTWGEGKRANWLGSLLLAARNRDNFAATGMLGSGLTEEQMKDLTEKLRPLITEEHDREVKIKPRIVIEVAYEEIQRSPKYSSGFALRFPRLLRIREDEKKPEDADTIKTMEKLFKNQRGRKK